MCRYANEEDEDWEEDRESDESVTLRAIRMMQWLATRPEKEIAVVTHSSWLKHLFKAFGHRVEDKDKRTLHRLSGNAEIRSITLALHKGKQDYGTQEEVGILIHYLGIVRVLSRRPLAWRHFCASSQVFSKATLCSISNTRCGYA